MTIHLVADDDKDAQRRARKLAEATVYDDERIPDRYLEIDHAIDDDMKDEIIGQYLYGATDVAP